MIIRFDSTHMLSRHKKEELRRAALPSPYEDCIKFSSLALLSFFKNFELFHEFSIFKSHLEVAAPCGDVSE